MSLAKSVLQERELWFASHFAVLHGYPCEATCRVTTAHALALLLRGEGPLEDRTEDRRIGLNMIYSIIFTEIGLLSRNFNSVTNNPNN